MKEKEKLTYSVSLVSQGKHKFYTLTMHIEALARTCFVSTREENPKDGFQRTLDKKRAQEIADYIDSGVGVIPNSIVLSTQDAANLIYSSRNRSVSFEDTPNAFLILDGQHRVYGFRLSKSDLKLRVPVVIFEGLSRTDEARLFIDINTKQKPVPSELLLDIKKLASLENSTEEYIRELFDLLSNDSESYLKGLMSNASKTRGKITRVTFNKSVKPFVEKIIENDPMTLFEVLNSYLGAVKIYFDKIEVNIITKPIIFTATVSLFAKVSSKVKDKYSGNYSVDNFIEVMKPLFEKLSKKPNVLKKPGSSSKKLAEIFENYLDDQPLEF